MSGGAWFFVCYFTIGFIVAPIAWAENLERERIEARVTPERDWRDRVFDAFIMSPLSMPGWIVAAFWPFELANVLERRHGRHVTYGKGRNR